MNKEEQKLVGYIIYDIWTYRVSSDHGKTFQIHPIAPEVHWRHKIYITEASANEAARHIIGKDNLHKAVIIPVYADRDDLDIVRDEWNHLKNIATDINNDNLLNTDGYKKLSMEEIDDIEYLQQNLIKALKIPLHLHGLKEDDVMGVKSLEITKQR